MNNLSAENLLKYKIIEDIFEFEDLDKETSNQYRKFQAIFSDLYMERAKLFAITDVFFYIRNNTYCNAFAKSIKGYNIIGITSGFIVRMLDIFNEAKFPNILSIALLNDVKISETFADLYTLENFKFNDFMLDCITQFTFHHEFQHILQSNTSKLNIDTYYFDEQIEHSKYRVDKHIREFDADRFSIFEVLKYIFQCNINLKTKNTETLKCLVLVGFGSVFLLIILFSLGLKDSNKKIEILPFYTAKYSHPHPLVRVVNIMDYYLDNIHDVIPYLKINRQELLNNSFGIVKLYLDFIFPKKNIYNTVFDELEINLTLINEYNSELYDLAIKDEAIRLLLIKRNINFNKN